MRTYSEWAGKPVSKTSIDQAALWITKMNQGDFDEDAFSLWLHQSPDNSTAYSQLSEVWAKTACLHKLDHYSQQSTRCTSSFICEQDYLLNDCQVTPASPATFYYLVIGLITIGCSLPLF